MHDEHEESHEESQVDWKAFNRFGRIEVSHLKANLKAKTFHAAIVVFAKEILANCLLHTVKIHRFSNFDNFRKNLKPRFAECMRRRPSGYIVVALFINTPLI